MVRSPAAWLWSKPIRLPMKRILSRKGLATRMGLISFVVLEVLILWARACPPFTTLVHRDWYFLHISPPRLGSYAGCNATGAPHAPFTSICQLPDCHRLRCAPGSCRTGQGAGRADWLSELSPRPRPPAFQRDSRTGGCRTARGRAGHCRQQHHRALSKTQLPATAP